MTAPVIYLDFDGVAHISNVYASETRGIYVDDPDHELFEYMPLLVDALAPFPAVRLVLSTSWVRELGYDSTVAHLRDAAGDDFAARVIGATYDPPHTPGWEGQCRYLQIRADVQRRGVAGRWLAIDDNDTGWPAGQRGKLVHTKSCGLRQLDLERLATLLAKLHA